MLVQSDYMFRRTSGVYQYPENRAALDDALFTSQIHLMGGHQLMVDVSRCSSVSPQKFTALKLCTAVNFLDVSFTHIESLREIAQNCTSLRSLVLAGLNSMPEDAYNQLSKLTTLECLSLRNSKNVSTKAIRNIKDLVMLRSLDLGLTKITSIDCLQGLTRLEELNLDINDNLYVNMQGLCCMFVGLYLRSLLFCYCHVPSLLVH